MAQKVCYLKILPLVVTFSVVVVVGAFVVVVVGGCVVVVVGLVVLVVVGASVVVVAHEKLQLFSQPLSGRFASQIVLKQFHKTHLNFNLIFFCC